MQCLQGATVCEGYVHVAVALCTLHRPLDISTSLFSVMFESKCQTFVNSLGGMALSKSIMVCSCLL